MKKLGLIALIALLTLVLMPAGKAVAHNNPTIRVDPLMVAPGGRFTVIGKDMGVDLEFAITLERVGRSIPLGTAMTTAQDGGEGGFTVSFSCPMGTPPGSYTVRAQTQSGKISAVTDITVTAAAMMSSAPSMAPMAAAQPGPSTAPLTMASPEPAAAQSAIPSAAPLQAITPQEATAEEHVLPRERSSTERYGAIAAAVVFAVIGTLLAVKAHD